MAYVGKTRDGVVPTVITPRRTSLDLKAAEDARRSRKSPANLETEEMTSIRADFLVVVAVPTNRSARRQIPVDSKNL
jgi:hypothetical protein